MNIIILHAVLFSALWLVILTGDIFQPDQPDQPDQDASLPACQPSPIPGDIDLEDDYYKGLFQC